MVDVYYTIQSLSTAQQRHCWCKSTSTCVGSSSVVRYESGQTRFQCQRDVLSSSPSTQTYPALARRWFGGYTRACLRHVARRLLQRSPRRGSENNQRVLNAAARVVSDTRKFDHGLSRLMHQELHWLDIPERVSYKLGMLTHRWLLGKAPVTPVPVQLLYPGRPGCNTSASTVCCTSSADCSATSSQHLRSLGIRCRWSDDVQHSAKWSARPLYQHINIRTIVENTPFLCLSARLAH